MKLNPDALRRPKREVKQYTFTDPSQPDKSFEIWLRPLDPLEDQAALSLADELAIKYVTGGFMFGGEWQKEPLPIHAVDGEALTVSERALRVVARLSVMQQTPNPDDKYSPEDLVRLWPCIPDAFGQLMEVMYKMSSGEEGWLKDPPSGRTD